MSEETAGSGVHKLNVKALALTFGIVSGTGLFLMGIAAAVTGDETLVTSVSGLYTGYGATVTGAVIGGVWGFFDGAIGGAIFGVVYNILSKKLA